MTNKLFYGDNLDVLRNEIASESVDLIYLDPPFNSNANYNILFKSKTGDGADAQIEAFEDTWQWNDHAEDAFDQVIRSGTTDAAELLRAMRTFLGENDMMAASWKHFADVKKQFASASAVGDRVVFNIGGNKYRLVVQINYDFQIIYVRFVGIHAEYDEVDVKNV